MPLDADRPESFNKNSHDRCRKSCLKKYKKPNLRGYRGKTFTEKVDYCVSSHYVCCKPEADLDAVHADIRAKCIEEVAQERQTERDS